MIDSTIKTSCAFTEIFTPMTLAPYISKAMINAQIHHAMSRPM